MKKKLKEFWRVRGKQILIQFVGVLASAILYFVLFFAGVFTLVNALIALAPIIITALANYIKERQDSEPLNLLALSFNYMLEGGFELSSILDVLISNKQRKRLFRDSKELFRVVSSRSKVGEYEEKRLIAESIGALYKINKKKTIEIIKTLRQDSIAGTWGDDIRRRTIEELKYLKNREEDIIVEQIKVDRKDSMYTILAIIEIIWLSKFFSLNEKKKRFADLSAKLDKSKIFIYKNGNQEFLEETDVEEFLVEVEALSEAMLKDISASDAKSLLENKFNNTENKYIKIFIAKNISLVCKKRNQCTKEYKCMNSECVDFFIDLFDMCFAESNHKNIRRAMARENVSACLLNMYSKNSNSNIEDRLIALAKDDDFIIPNTFLDYSMQLFNSCEALYDKVLEYFRQEDEIDALIEAVKNTLPVEMQPYIDYVKANEKGLCKYTLLQFLKNSSDVEIPRQEAKRLLDKLRLQEHAERVDKNIKALKAYKKN